MVPRPFGLAFLACFEELDKELCDPKIRAYMEQQVTKIATGETDKTQVVESTLELFSKKFIDFRLLFFHSYLPTYFDRFC